MDACTQLTEMPRGLGLTLSEQLTGQFYAWEQRGRGWRVWNQPVELEPPFRPFFFQTPQSYPVPDDGRSDTFFSKLIRNLLGAPQDEPDSAPDPQTLETEPNRFLRSLPLSEIRLTLPPDLDVAKIAAEHLLLNLACREPVGFEIIGTEQAIVVQFACGQPDAAHVRQQVKAHFPDLMLTEERDYLLRHWDQVFRADAVVVDFGLSSEFIRPINTFRTLDIDPLVGIAGALDRLEQGEVGVFQVLFQPARNPWAESIIHSVTDWEGRSFFVDAPEMAGLAREKIAFPLYAVIARVAAASPHNGRAWEIVRGLGAALAPYNNPASNELVPLSNDDYPDVLHEQDLLLRQSRRSGMILSSDELVCLAHLPSPRVRAERLNRKVARTKAAPAVTTGGEILLGQNVHNGKNLAVTLSTDQRVKHTYVVGASGTGKSTFLLNLIGQDIKNGRGVAVLDPHGDLIDDVLGRIPEHRHPDVVLFDPADEEYPIGFNVLSAHSDLERQLIASDMVAVFQRLSTSWGDQMTTVLSNAILAFLESDRGGSLADLRRFLVEEDYRREFLKSVCDRDVVYYWEKEFPLLSGRPQGPILTRLDAFLRPKLIRYMVAQKENRLDFADIMNSSKIFLARLAQGAIGEENAHLLGTLLMSKFHQITLSRQELRESERKPFYLYIDEFHNFVTPSMASILTGVRKYRLGLVLAHQELRQLEKRDSEVAAAALSNPYTRVCFRVGESDARKLAEGLRYFEMPDLLDLATGEAVCRVERADCDFNLSVIPPSTVDATLARQRRTQITALSRQRYGTPLREVETFLETQWQKTKGSDEPPATPSETRVERKPLVAPEPELPPAAGEPPLAVPQPPRPARRASSTSTIMGKGGTEHRYLQQFIKRWAEGMGYRATIEKTLDNGTSIDVALEKGDTSIECEIAVTTTSAHELDNLKKCLAACCTHVITVSTDAAKLAAIEHATREAFAADELERVRFLSPDALFRFIETIEAEAASREHTSRGYKVKVKYGTLADQDKKARKRAVSQVILGALTRHQ